MDEQHLNAAQPTSLSGSPGHEGESRHADGRIEHPSVRYERKDIAFGQLLGLIVAAVSTVLALGGGAWWFFRHQRAIEDAAKRSPYVLPVGRSDVLPPEPRLEQLDRGHVTAATRADAELQAKAAALNSYGPTAEKGFVHIPIQQAIQSIAGTLPVAKKRPGPTTHDQGLLDGGQPNSGRMFRGPQP